MITNVFRRSSITSVMYVYLFIVEMDAIKIRDRDKGRGYDAITINGVAEMARILFSLQI